MMTEDEIMTPSEMSPGDMVIIEGGVRVRTLAGFVDVKGIIPRRITKDEYKELSQYLLMHSEVLAK